MHPSDELAVLPGVVRQIGYVVRDLDQTIATWLELGVGPWYVLRDQPQRGLYHGQPCAVTLSVAFANSGDLQVELIQQTDDAPSVYNEFLDSGHEGFHQLAWWTPDFEATMKAVRGAGWPVVWSGAEEGSPSYAYVEPPAGPATIIEIMEQTPSMEGLASLVRSAADNWDGSDPIRSLSG